MKISTLVLSEKNYSGKFRHPAVAAAIFSLLLLGAASAPTAHAAVKTWDGTTSGNWGTSANWTPAGVPIDGDDLIFPAGALNPVNTNNLIDLRVASITFNGAAGGYVLNGNAITISNGVVAAHTAGDNDLNLAFITNATSQTYTVDSGGTLDVNANIVMTGGFTLTINNDFNARLDGTISGTGNLLKSNSGTGTLFLGGALNNTYTGTTTVDQGTLDLNDSASASELVPGNLTINNGGIVLISEIGGNQIADDSNIAINGTGLLNLNDQNETIASLSMGGGTVDTGTGTLTLGGNLSTVASPTTATINGNLSIGGITRTFTVGAGTANPDLLVAAIISGSGGLTKAGTGDLRLNGANTYSGATIVSAGTLALGNDAALGTTASGTTVNSGATLFLDIAVLNLPEVLTLNGAGVSASGALHSIGIANVQTNLVLGSATTIHVSTNGGFLGSLAINGTISGTGPLTKIGVGTLTLGGAGNTYTGITTVNDGTVVLNTTAGSAIPGDFVVGDDTGAEDSAVVRMAQATQFPTVNVTVNAEGLLDLNDFSETVNNLTLAGGRAVSGTNGTAAALFVSGFINIETPYPLDTHSQIGGLLNLGTGTQFINFPVGSLAIGAPELELDARVTGSAAISVTGNSGDLFLNSSNDFTGGFTVDGGNRLLVHIGNDFALGANTAGTTNIGSAGFFIEVAANNISEPLTLCGTGPIGNGGVLSLTGVAAWSTNVVLACDATINCPAGTLLTINGGISGTGSLTKIGVGTLAFIGSPGNTYAGNTIVNEGKLILNKSSLFAIPSGQPLIIGDGIGGVDADVVQYDGPSMVNSSSPITINSSGLLNLNDFDDGLGAFTLLAGDIQTGAGTLTMANNVTAVSESGNPAKISGKLALGASTRTFTVTDGPNGFDLQIFATVSGTGGITKAGDGDMQLLSSNTFSGLVTINNGVLFASDDFALGTTNTGTIVQSNATLAVQVNVHVGLEPLTLDSTGGPVFASLASFAGIQSNSWVGAITLARDTKVRVDTNATLNLIGPISGSGSLTKSGSGTLHFSGGTANTYAGTTTVNGGTLVLAKSVPNGAIVGPLVIGDGVGGVNADVVRLEIGTQIGNNSSVLINSSGLLDLDGSGEAVGSIAGGGNLDFGAGAAFLNVGFDNLSTTFSGIISGAGDLTKFSGTTGTLTLNGNNTYLGTTTVNGGTLLVNGSQPQSPVSIGSSGTLGGIGTAGNLAASGVIAPGTSPGILTSSNVTFTATGSFPVELNGTTAGSGYDQLNVRGTNNLTGAALSVSVGFLPTEGDQFRIINNDGADAITGTFDTLPEGAVVNSGNFRFRISYVGGTGNDVVLTVTNQFLKPGGAFVFSGNGNGAIEPNECNLLSLVVSNLSGVAMTGLNARLHSVTPGVAVTQPFSTYPNIPANNRRTNDSMFQVTTAPGFVCGSDVNLELEVVTATHGTLIVPFSLPSGVAGAGVRFNNNIVTAIPDASFVDSTVAVAGITTPLKKVVVLLHITHTAASDLDVSLIGPDGTIVELTSDNGGVASDYGVDCTDPGRTTFDSSAATSITAGVAPFVGTFRPEQSLASFNEKSGAAVNGLWTLRVVDDTPGAVGSIRCWSLLLSPTACTPGSGICELCPEVTISSATGPASLTQTNFITLNGIASVCGVAKPCPGTSPISSIPFESYTFRNGPTNACVTVLLENLALAGSSADMISAAYLGSFDAANPNKCLNYLADVGSAAAPLTSRSYSFDVASNATFVVTVLTDVSSVAPYNLTVSGGDCRPVLNIAAVAATQAALDWTTAAPGYRLERTNHLTGVAGTWESIPGVPLVVNSRFTVTNNVSGTNQFYRLVKP